MVAFNNNFRQHEAYYQAYKLDDEHRNIIDGKRIPLHVVVARNNQQRAYQDEEYENSSPKPTNNTKRTIFARQYCNNNITYEQQQLRIVNSKSNYCEFDGTPSTNNNINNSSVTSSQPPSLLLTSPLNDKKNKSTESFSSTISSASSTSTSTSSCLRKGRFSFEKTPSSHNNNNNNITTASSSSDSVSFEPRVQVHLYEPPIEKWTNGNGWISWFGV